MRYFGLGNDGRMYDLCDCGDFEAADESANDLLEGTGTGIVWIADEDTALEWCDRILQSTFGFTTADLADWDLTEEG